MCSVPATEGWRSGADITVLGCSSAVAVRLMVVVGRHQAVVVGWSFPCPQAVVVAVEVVGKDREWLKQLAHFCTAGHALRH